MSWSRYTSFFSDKRLYTYTDVVTGREIVGPVHGVLKKLMKYHAVLTQLDLLAIHKSQVPNCIGIEGLDLCVG